MDMIASLLTHTRTQRGLSKAAAAAELGVNRLTYDMWEKRASLPALDKLDGIAHFTSQPRERILDLRLRDCGWLAPDQDLLVLQRRDGVVGFVYNGTESADHSRRDVA